MLGRDGSRAASALSLSLSLGLVALGCDDAGGEDEGAGTDSADSGDEESSQGGDSQGGDSQGEDETTEGDSQGDQSDAEGDSAETGDPGPMGVFLAVGDGGRRARSSDGLEWTEMIGSGVVDTRAEEGEEDILRAVAVGEGIAIAVGGGGNEWSGNAMIMRSGDGLEWEEDLVGGMEALDEQKLFAVGFSEGVFVAAGSQAHILRSDDGGQSWTRPYPEHHGRTPVFGVAGHAGIFVLVGMHQDEYDSPKLAYVHRSTDGGQSFGAPSYFGEDGAQLESVASNGGRFVAVGPDVCLRSDDGDAWDPCGLSGEGYGGVTFTNGRFVVTYLDGVSTSSDGEQWSAHLESPTGVPERVVYGNGVYAGVRYYDRGTSDALGEWAFVTHGSFPLRALEFMPLE